MQGSRQGMGSAVRAVVCVLLAGLLLAAVAVPASGGANPASAVTAKKKKCKKAKKGATAGKKKRGCKKPPKPAQLAISPTSADYGFVLGRSSKTLSFLLRNSGGRPAGIPDISIQDSSTYGGNPVSAFFLASSSCETPLPPSSTCTIQVQYEPPLDGTLGRATLTVSATPGGSASSQLTGAS